MNNHTDFIKTKRKVIFLASMITALLFIGFTSLIAVSPTTLPGLTFIYIGFGLIAYSIAIVAWYGVWSKKRYAQLSGE